MNLEDIVYLFCLLTCIGFGKYFRSIKDDSQRKLIGTGLGASIVFIVSGIHVLHCLISFTICAMIITKIHPSRCHIISFIFMFGYLVFFRTTHYFGLPAPPGHTNMIQMILTLKIAGVAFEKNVAYNKIAQRNKETKKDDDKQLIADKDVEITEYDVELQDVTITELFHYSFNYIGVLIGPYYRYRTYRDYYETPFKNYADCTTATIEKLKSTAIFCTLYLIASYIWPLSYATSDEFYQKRTVLYRLFYVWPTFFIFRMRIYTGITLGECVCTYAGFGAYPDEADAVSGEGPRKQYLHLKRDPEKHNYNFITIKNLDAYGVESCLTFRESIKHWNICIQYWLAVNIYRRFPSKKYRTLVTLLVSSFWHGFYAGHYFCIMGAPFYIPVEDIYLKFYEKLPDGGIKKRICYALFWTSKFFSQGYLGTAFLLLTFDKIWFYYSSVYHLGYIYYLIMLVIALQLVRAKKAESRKQRDKLGDNVKELGEKLVNEEHIKKQ